MSSANKTKVKKSPASDFVLPLRSFKEIIEAVTTPLGLTVLVVLFLGCIVAVAIGLGLGERNLGQLITGMLGMFAFVVVLVFLTAWLKPGVIFPGRNTGGIQTGGDSEALLREHEDVLHFRDGPPEPDAWTKELLPVLHQAAIYTVPTYFLDTKLRIIDWNVAFDLVFDAAASLRGKHVNYFIVKLENREQVFDHAREFTIKVEKGQLPLVDTECLCYASADFGGQNGLIAFLKVAVQLHDPQGNHRGWSVALFPQEINWPEFQRRLEAKILDDKLWSVYSSSYDRVLANFPPYRKLIADVIGVVPPAAHKVADLGAGTGNVTKELTAHGHRVTAVENNQGMLDKLREKHFTSAQVSVVKGSVQGLELLPDESFDAAVMVNVLYAIEDPLGCLENVCRILKRGGMLGLSTTHAETRLSPLLASIKNHLQTSSRWNQLSGDYQALEEANRHLELTIARRYSRDQYREWVRQAGFEIVNEIPSTYEGAVMVIHARKL